MKWLIVLANLWGKRWKMKDKKRTKERLIEGIELLKRRITELEKSEFERKKVEELLRESEEKFRLAFENAKDAIFWADPLTGTITNCNKAAEVLLEKKREEIIGQHQTTIHPPQKAEFYANMFKKHIEEKGAVDNEAEVITKTGEIKSVHISASLTLVGEKQIIQGIFRDITQYKRAEEELKESEEQFRSVTEQSPNMIFINKKGRVVYVNERSERVMGYRREEFYSPDFDFLALIAPEYRELVKANFSNHIKDEETPPYGCTLLTKEDKRIEAILATRLIRYGGESAILGIVTDIAEHKRAEEVLTREHNLLRTVIDNLPDYIYIKDKDGQYIVSNKAHARFLGKETPDEVIGKTVFELFPREMPERYAADDQKIIQTGQPLLNRQEQSIDQKGDKVWNLTTKVPLQDSDGKVLGLVGIARDITVRRKAEEAVRESEERYRTLVQNVPVAVYRTTPGPRGKFLMGNPTCLKIFGLDSEEELKKIDVADVYMNPEERKAFSDNLLAKASVEGIELALRRKDGTPFWGSVTAMVVYDKSGENPYFDTTIIDITDRKKAEEALRESEERYRTLVQNIPIGVYRTTPGPKGKFLIANPTYMKMFGFDSEEELKKIDVADVYINPEERNVFSDNLLAKGTFEGIELALRRKDGTPFWGSVTARVVYDENGEDPYFDCTIVDITDRKKAEEEKEKIQAELLQVQKMEAIGMLAGGVAHDFNNLLTIIQGCTELAMEKVNEPVPLYRDLNQIRLAAMRAASLTRQLLLFSRRHPIKPTPLNINRTIDSLLKMLNRVIGEDIAINTDLESDLWTVWADAENIEQVIMNLAVNAKDAMPKGGRLTIKTKNVTLEEECRKVIPEARPGKFACVSLEDTGFGMDKEIIPRIFEPFFSTKGSGKRIGLGLSAVYGIVKQHEGWINVYSEPGRGSTFKVYLPVFSVKPEDETKKTISLQELKGRGERILLVEDEEGVRELGTRVLRANGYVVFEAANAKEAIDIFEREVGKFHLIFCDVVLPDKNSFQLVDQLLCRKPELRVLLSSGYVDQKSQLPIIHEMGFRFLQKPYALSDLLRTVREVIEQAE
jgi:PAS domain S-box-containing protein